MNGAAVLIILLLAFVVAPLRAHPARERRLRNLAVLRHAATSRPDALVGLALLFLPWIGALIYALTLEPVTTGAAALS